MSLDILTNCTFFSGKMTTSFKLETGIAFTPQVLASFPDLKVVVEEQTDFQTSASILSCVSGKLRKIFRDHSETDETLLIMCGFSDQFGQSFRELIVGGEIHIRAQTLDQCEDYVQKLKFDFQSLDITVPGDFWKIPKVKKEPSDVGSDTTKTDLETWNSGDDGLETLSDMDTADFVEHIKEEYVQLGASSDTAQTDNVKDSCQGIDLDAIVYRAENKQGELVRYYRCSFCSKPATSVNSWLVHIQRKHQNKYHLAKGPYPCKQCKRYATSLRPANTKYLNGN